jgi:enoyl-CoA hydratase/carnithine racemase
MTIAPKSFLYAVDAGTGVATITLNRPDKLNALTFEVYRELTDAFRALGGEPGVRAVVITGAGRAFCSGGDVEDIIGPLLTMKIDELRAFTRLTCDLILAIRRCPRPVVAALNGTVAGAGAVIASACDFRVATERAKIAFLFVRVGLSGADMGAAWLLPRLVGHSHATEMLMTGEFTSAQRAKEIGLYHQVVADAELMGAATALAAKLARGPKDALAATKAAIDLEAALTLEAGLDHEAEAQALLMLGPDYQEGYRAFTEKRDPRFP